MELAPTHTFFFSQEKTHYLSLEILFEFQTGNSDALFPLARPSAQQLNHLECPIQTFPRLHPLQHAHTQARAHTHKRAHMHTVKTVFCRMKYYTAGLDQHNNYLQQVRTTLLTYKVLPVVPLQPRGGSARTSCTWRACGQTHFQTTQTQGKSLKLGRYTDKY